MTTLGAEYFDDWYANMAHSPTQAAIQQSALGLPPEVESTSLLPWDGIADVVDALCVGPGDVLVDLACGRGGYGLEIARRTGARLVGIDFSAVAIARARALATERWSRVEAEFRVGELTATGLSDASADAVLCVDAMQFATPYAAGLAEVRRILSPGGRLVLTGWQPKPGALLELPSRIRYDIVAEVVAAGFANPDARQMSAWQAAELAMWQAAAATADDDGDPAMDSMRAEAARVLPVHDKMQRLMVTAFRL
jgi:ubiquinone/menaquinone biosynthesis C-methylase UbiE